MVKNKWFIIAVLFPLLSCSQESSSKSRLNTVASLGIIAGESTAKPLFQVVSGVAFRKWFTGIGAGLDYYNLKSIPLFVDCKMKFGETGSGFLYADGGYNFPFDNKSEFRGFQPTSNRFLGGLYIDAGVGYRVKINSFHRLSFSAGYSRKNIVNKIAYHPFCPAGNCPEDVYKYHYTTGRIVTKFSWEFGK
jgi:hypothetical protein